MTTDDPTPRPADQRPAAAGAHDAHGPHEPFILHGPSGQHSFSGQYGSSQPGSPGDPGPQAPGSGPAAPDGVQNFFDSVRRSPVTRSDDRWAGGVCAGVAERIGIDPVILRVLLLVTTFVGGFPAIAYGVGWLLLPDRRGRIESEAAIRGDVSAGAVGAGLLVLFAGLLPQPWRWWWPGADVTWGGNALGGLVLTGVVVAAVLLWPQLSEAARGGRAAQNAPADAQVPPQSPVAPRPPVPPQPPAPPRPPVRSKPSRRGPGAVTGTAVVGLAMVAAGLAGLWAAQADVDLTVRLAAVLAATAVLGLATIGLGLAGRTDGWVGGLGVTAALFALWWSLVPSSADVIVGGDDPWAPRSVAVAEDGFLQLFGNGDIDLTNLDLDDVDPSREVVVPVRLGIGELVVTVPDGVPVSVRSRVLVGEADDAATELPRGWTSQGRSDGTGADLRAERTGGKGPRLVVDVQGFVGGVDLVVADR